MLDAARPELKRFKAYMTTTESVKKLGRYAVSWIAWWPKRPSSTAVLT